MIQLDDGREAAFITESGMAEPDELTAIDDTTRAADAYRMIEAGRVLLWTGDYMNGRQLLGALKRRATGRQAPSQVGGLWARWQAERSVTRARGELLSHVVVLLEPSGELKLRRAPETAHAAGLAWGPSEAPRVVALNTLVGALSAAQWTLKGVEVPGLDGKITPRFGVFSPTRRAYVDLLDFLDPRGCSVLDVGCGTGVLGFVMLQRGAAYAVGTDIEDRAVQCAQGNAKALGLGERFHAVRTSLFDDLPPGERYDLVLFNAPWVPETPRTALDRAVFDENGDTLRRFLNGVSDRLTEGGVAALIISDLPEQLGLREEDELEGMIQGAGLSVHEAHSVPANHKRAKDTGDPLHRVRSAERIQLLILAADCAS